MDAISDLNRDTRDTPRSHRSIVREITVPRLRQFLADRDPDSVPSQSAVQRWGDRDSIPGDVWNALEEGGFATLKELAAYAESKKSGVPAAAEAATTAQP
jgi:TPP-dependent pyruvate/acetoin dehydrogenase alpha subunit